MSIPTPRDCIRYAIERWEGVYGNDSYDPGNWITMPDGTRQIAGSKYGVTPAALAAHRGKKPWEMTADVMKAMPLEEALDIGETMFYRGTGIDTLPWGPATAVLLDIGWGTGVGQAVKLMQRLVGVNADGRIGPLTIDAYTRWIASVGWEQGTREMHRIRMEFYRMLGRQNPAAFGPPQPGWKNRADWMLPGGEWWAHWAEMPPLPTPAEIAPKPAAVAQKPVAPAPEASGGKAIAGVLGGGGLVTTLAPTVAPHIFTANWTSILAIGGVIVVGAAVAFLIWRLHEHDKQARMS